MDGSFADAVSVAQGLSGFALRNHWHGYGLGVVSGLLEELGFHVMEHGIEFSEGLAGRVNGQDDRCSLMLRFRPDLAGILPGTMTVLCEVKCPAPKPTFPDSVPIEARAYSALREWNNGGNVGMLAYVLLRDKDGRHFVGASWLSDIPTPRVVLVPRRNGFDGELHRMEKLFPYAEIRPCDHKPGSSGTPYVRIPTASFSRFADFAKAEFKNPRVAVVGNYMTGGTGAVPASSEVPA